MFIMTRGWRATDSPEEDEAAAAAAAAAPLARTGLDKGTFLEVEVEVEVKAEGAGSTSMVGTIWTACSSFPKSIARTKQTY